MQNQNEFDAILEHVRSYLLRKYERGELEIWIDELHGFLSCDFERGNLTEVMVEQFLEMRLIEPARVPPRGLRLVGATGPTGLFRILPAIRVVAHTQRATASFEETNGTPRDSPNPVVEQTEAPVQAELVTAGESEPDVLPPWYKTLAPPVGEWHGEPLVGTLKELAAWNGVAVKTIRRKSENETLWIMREPDGRWSCYFRTPAQHATANKRRLENRVPKSSKEDQRGTEGHDIGKG